MNFNFQLVERGLNYKSPHILLVDDDVLTLEIFSALLETLGCRVETALNGEIALEKISKSYYDLMILDWNMSNMNGEKTLEKINQIGFLL